MEGCYQCMSSNITWDLTMLTEWGEGGENVDDVGRR